MVDICGILLTSCLHEFSLLIREFCYYANYLPYKTVVKKVANRRFPLYTIIHSHYLFSNITPANTVLPRIIASAIINFEGNFARKYFVNFLGIWYFGESSRSVIRMIPHFGIKRYPREWGKSLYTSLGMRLFEGGNYSSKG